MNLPTFLALDLGPRKTRLATCAIERYRMEQLTPPREQWRHHWERLEAAEHDVDNGLHLRNFVPGSTSVIEDLQVMWQPNADICSPQSVKEAILDDLAGPTRECGGCGGDGIDGDKAVYTNAPNIQCNECHGSGRVLLPMTLCGRERKPFHNQFARVDPNGAFWLEHECDDCNRILSWQDGTVRRIAQSIYDERAWDHMPVLADALEEAGCENAVILDHCRSKYLHCDGNGFIETGLVKCDAFGVHDSRRKHECVACKGTGRLPAIHFRGCAVVDLLLGVV